MAAELLSDPLLSRFSNSMKLRQGAHSLSLVLTEKKNKVIKESVVGLTVCSKGLHRVRCVIFDALSSKNTFEKTINEKWRGGLLNLNYTFPFSLTHRIKRGESVVSQRSRRNSLETEVICEVSARLLVFKLCRRPTTLLQGFSLFSSKRICFERSDQSD
jgi:hypothetical protein